MIWYHREPHNHQSYLNISHCKGMLTVSCLICCISKMYLILYINAHFLFLLLSSKYRHCNVTLCCTTDICRHWTHCVLTIQKVTDGTVSDAILLHNLLWRYNATAKLLALQQMLWTPMVTSCNKRITVHWIPLYFQRFLRVILFKDTIIKQPD